MPKISLLCCTGLRNTTGWTPTVGSDGILFAPCVHKEWLMRISSYSINSFAFLSEALKFRTNGTWDRNNFIVFPQRTVLAELDSVYWLSPAFFSLGTKR